jgi:hypothetical protein
MKKVLTWIGLVGGVAMGGMLVFSAIDGARRRADRGLATVERVARDTRQALNTTEQALDETQRIVSDVREAIR